MRPYCLVSNFAVILARASIFSFDDEIHTLCIFCCNDILNFARLAH